MRQFGGLTVIGVIFVTFWVGMAAASVGNTGSCETFTWTLPFNMFIVVGGAFALGYLGRMEEQG